MKLLPIDEKDEVRLCYIDKRSPNLFDDLQSIHLTGDTLQQIVGMLQGIEQYEVLNSRVAANKFHYSLEISSCVTHTSNALNLSGIFNIGLHPYLLNAQMYLWSHGLRPWTIYNLFNN